MPARTLGERAIQQADQKFRNTPEGREKHKMTQKRYRDTPTGLLVSAAANARRRGRECTLTPQDVEGLVAPMRCAVTGMPLIWGGHKHPLSPSLDRKDNSLGYTPENTQCVALWVNYARSTRDLEEFKAVLRQFDPTKMTR